ncbi:MAG: flagellar basal body protein [Parvularculaceae bacterium]
MFTDIKLMQTASMLARYAAERNAQVAENIANADTPGFKAKDLEPFSEAYARAERAEALSPDRRGFSIEKIGIEGVASPDGNTVSLEDQMTRSAAAARDHSTALTIYSKALSMLRTSLGGRG